MYICKNACSYTFEQKIFDGLLIIEKLILTGVMST